MYMTVQFNPDVRALYEEIIKRNVVHNPRDEFEYMPERYGGGRVRDMALSGNDGHFPSNQQIIHSNMGGAYGRASHPIAVGSGRYERRCGGVGILKERVEPFMNNLDMDYIPVSASHGAGRKPRLTNKIKQMLLEQHPELMQQHLAGGAIPWAKIWKGIKDVGSFVSKAAPIAAQLAGPEYSDSINKVGDISGKISGLGRPKAPRITNAIKQRIMAQHPEIRDHVMSGGAVNWSKLWSGLKSTLGVVSKLAPVAAQLAPEYSDQISQVGNVSGAISGMGHGGNFSHMLAIDLARRAMSKKKGGNAKQFFKNFGTGFKTGLKDITGVAAKVAPIGMLLAPEFAPEIGAVGALSGITNKALGGRRKRMTLPRSGHKREVARGDIVSAIMRQRGVGLGEASRIVKQEGLY